MTSIQASLLGIIQGITEMLPISSSTHLVLFSNFCGLPNQRLSFDIFLNIGSILAVMVFFWPQVWSLIKGGICFLCNKKTEDRAFFTTILLANLPIIVLFGIAEMFLDVNFQSVFLLSGALIIFGVILWACDRTPDEKADISRDVLRRIPNVSRKDAIYVGFAQLLSIVPGVSRLGICFSAMRYLNYSRSESYKFSMILSIFPIVGACFLNLMKCFTGKLIIDDWSLVFFGSFFAFIFGLLVLFFMKRFLRRHSILLFAVYRIILGIFLLF